MGGQSLCSLHHKALDSDRSRSPTEVAEQIRLAANGSVSTARMGFHGLHCGAGRFEWSEDLPRLHRRVRLLKLPCQTHWLVDEKLLAKHDAVAAHRRLDQIAHLETDRIADVLGDGELELRADLGCSASHGYESPTFVG